MTVELYATNRFPGDGTTTQYEINFSGGYMDKSHVKAYVEDAETLAREDFVITSSMFVGPYTINVGVTTPVGKTFVIYRDTPKGEPLVDFVNGSRITEQNLDKVARQAVLGLAEVYDASNAAVVAEFTAAAQNVVDAKDAAIAAGAGAQAAQTAAEAAQAAAVAAKDDAQDIADSINPSQFASATALAATNAALGDTNTVVAGKLSNADGAVTLSKLVDGILAASAAGLAKMADGFLAATTAGRAKMADLFVTTSKLADSAVTTIKLAANAVTTAKLAREGSAGQVMTSNGAGADPSYQDVQGVGYGQTWQDVTASRAFGTVYTNTTGKPIVVNVWAASSATNGNKQINIYIGGAVHAVSGFHSGTGNNYPFATAVVPAGQTYGADTFGSNVTITLSGWRELR